MFTTRPEILGTFGVVASTHWLASATGMAVLEKGGNAFDAAVAMGFALQVVEPHLNGPGGDMPMLVYSASERRLRVVCGQGPAPAAAAIPRFRDLGLDIIPGTGLLPACVPGALDAWLTVLRDYGSLPLADVLSPAIAFARDGYPLISHICNTIDSVASCSRPIGRPRLPSTSRTARCQRRAPCSATRHWPTAMSASYGRARQPEEAGRSASTRRAWAIYSGFVAEAVDRFCRTQEVMDTSGRSHHGLLTGSDMAQWQATYDEPVTYDYHGYTIAKPGPWAQSPVFLQMLALLKGFDLATLDPLGPDFAHLVIEAAKLAFADREAYYGDPAFVDVPMTTLLSEGYNVERRKLIADQASMELRPGRIDGFGQRIAVGSAAAASAAGAGEPTMARVGTGDTCHIDVIDRFGNMVSATPSGGWLESSPVIPELGFVWAPAGRCSGSGGPAGNIETGQAASHHAEPVLRLPRRRALHAVRYARRRRPGSMRP